LFFWGLRLLKTAFPLPPQKPEGGGRRQKPEFWEFVRGKIRELTGNKKTKATLNFCDSRAFRLAQKLPRKGGREEKNCHYA